MQHLAKKVKIVSEKAGLYLKIKKTKLLFTAPCNSLTINGENVEVVTSFVYLDSTIEGMEIAKQK